MPTFADEVLDQGRLHYPPWATDNALRKLLDKINLRVVSKLGKPVCPVINIENVFEHTFREIRAGKTSLEALPCIAPPFDQFWCEGKHDIKLISDEGEIHRSFPSYFGVFVQDVTKRPSLVPKALCEDVQPETYTWEVDAVIYLQIERKVFGPFAVWKFWLDENGKCISELFTSTDTDDELPEEVRLPIEASFYQMILACMWTVSFMHCKNSVTEIVSPPPALSKKHRKKHGRPYLKHQVIKIDTIERAVERLKSGSVSNGRDVAWHIVPGKMRDYREKGLFGRWHGLFWFPQHARGSKKAGINENDYEVSE